VTTNTGGASHPGSQRLGFERMPQNQTLKLHHKMIKNPEKQQLGGTHHLQWCIATLIIRS
jgi:hypothetical protein